MNFRKIVKYKPQINTKHMVKLNKKTGSITYTEFTSNTQVWNAEKSWTITAAAAGNKRRREKKDDDKEEYEEEEEE